MPASHPLLATNAPWVHLLPLGPGQTAESVLKPPTSLHVANVDGRACRTKDRLLREFARALRFPDYFGENWDALEECLCDLEWLPVEGYALVMQHANEVLADEPEQRTIWIRILRAAGKHWATHRPPRPFHAILGVEGRRRSLHKKWHIALWTAR